LPVGYFFFCEQFGHVPGQSAPSIIPAPVEMKVGKEVFKVLPSTTINSPAKNKEARKIADILATKLIQNTGFTIPVVEGMMTANTGNIILTLNSTPDKGFRHRRLYPPGEFRYGQS
jgi:hypothetical protein